MPSVQGGGLPREHTGVQLPARAPHADRAMLGDDDERLWCVEDLAAFDSLGRSMAEILPARHATDRLVIDDLVGIGPHGEVLARGTGLLAPIALHLVLALTLASARRSARVLVASA